MARLDAPKGPLKGQDIDWEITAQQLAQILLAGPDVSVRVGNNNHGEIDVGLGSVA